MAQRWTGRCNSKGFGEAVKCTRIKDGDLQRGLAQWNVWDAEATPLPPARHSPQQRQPPPAVRLTADRADWEIQWAGTYGKPLGGC